MREGQRGLRRENLKITPYQLEVPFWLLKFENIAFSKKWLYHIDIWENHKDY